MSTISSDIPLFICGSSNVVNYTPLFIQGRDIITDSIPLYIFGLGFIGGLGGDLGPPPSRLNLFLKGRTAPVKSAHIPLSIYGSTTPTMVRGITLFVKGVVAQFNESMPLFIQVDSQGNHGNTLNLFLKSEIPGLRKSIPLFLKNAVVVSDNSIWLFIKGVGTNPGSRSESGNIPLFLKQGSVSTPFSHNIPLFLGGVAGTSRTIPLYTTGCIRSVNLSIPCIITGIVPISTQGNINLVIPHTVNTVSDSVHLYTHGFDYSSNPGV